MARSYNELPVEIPMDEGYLRVELPMSLSSGTLGGSGGTRPTSSYDPSLKAHLTRAVISPTCQRAKLAYHHMSKAFYYKGEKSVIVC